MEQIRRDLLEPIKSMSSYSNILLTDEFLLICRDEE